VKLRFTDQAIQEIVAARSYFKERREELGHRFDNALSVATKTIAQSPERYQVFWKDRRRVFLKGFRYFLVYFVVGDDVAVLGCLHSSRNPATWMKRALD